MLFWSNPTRTSPSKQQNNKGENRLESLNRIVPGSVATTGMGRMGNIGGQRGRQAWEQQSSCVRERRAED